MNAGIRSCGAFRLSENHGVSGEMRFNVASGGKREVRSQRNLQSPTDPKAIADETIGEMGGEPPFGETAVKSESSYEEVRGGENRLSARTAAMREVRRQGGRVAAMPSKYERCNRRRRYNSAMS